MSHLYILFLYCEIGEHSPLLKFHDFSGSRIFLDPGLSWKLDGLEWVYEGGTLHMNLISLKKSKKFFTKFSQKVAFKTTFWKHKCPFYWGVVVFQNICLFVVFFCLFVSLYLLALLPHFSHFATLLPFCCPFAFLWLFCLL